MKVFMGWVVRSGARVVRPVGLAAIAAWGVSAPAFAQDPEAGADNDAVVTATTQSAEDAADVAAAPKTDAPPARRKGVLDEIVVTARKTEERLQDAPVSITAFGARELRERGVSDLYDISVATPGLQFEKLGNRYGAQNGGTRPVIRGMSSIGSESNVAFFVDGILYSNNMMSFPMELVERVEVIKGPQSALFGRSTFSGAINYITKQPTNETENEISARIAQYNDYEVNTISRGALVEDKVFYMVHGRYYDFGGEHKNRLDGQKVGQENSVGVNAALTFHISDRLTASLGGGYNEDDDGLASSVLQPATLNNCFQNDYRQYYCGDIVPENTTDIDIAALQGLEGLRRESKRLTAGFEYDFGGVRLISNSGFFSTQDEYGYDSDYISAGRTGTNLRLEVRDRREWSTELRLQSAQGQRFRWLAGVFFYDRDLDAEQRRIVESVADLDLGNTQVENRAVFGAVTYDLTSTLSGSVELRYAEDELVFNAADGNVYKTTNDNVTPRVTLDWKVSDESLLYAVVAKGNKPGDVNDDPRLPAELIGVDEEESWAYEIGTKNTLFEGRVTMNLAAYFIDWSKQQLTESYIYPVDGSSISYSVNVGKTEIHGLEYTLDMALSESLLAGFSYGLTDAKFKVFDAEEAEGLFGDASVEGRRTPNTAKNEAILYAKWTHDFSSGMSGFVRTDFTYSEGKYAQVFNLASTGDKATVNLRVGVQTPRFDASLYVRNLTDDDTPSSVIRYADNKNRLPIGDSNRISTIPRGFLYPIADGRRIGLNLRYRF